jgi:hypothetical protein
MADKTKDKSESLFEGFKRHRIRITCGQHMGRYIGPPFGAGYVSNPEVLKNPPVNVPGGNYGLWVQERGSTEFFGGNTTRVQSEFKALGYESELVEVK